MMAMSEIVLGLLVGGLALLLYFLYKFAYAPYQLLKRYGINALPHTPFLGHYKDRVKMSALIYNQMLVDKFGPISGYYIGPQPFILINDLDMLKQIMVKDFDSFTDHTPLPNFLTDLHDPEPKDLFTSRGETWRGVRKVLSPSFSASKMKMMLPHIKKSIENLMTVLGEKATTGDSFNILKVYDAFTLEAILSMGFSRQADIQLGESDEFANAMREVVAGFADGQIEAFTLLNSYFARLMPLIFIVLSYTPTGKLFEYVKKVALDLIRARREERNPDKYKDILQLMIDATGEEEEETEEQDSECPASKPRKTRGVMTDAEVFANVIGLIGAAQEGTGTTLTFTSYLLALHPDIQEKLQSDIDDYFEERPDANFYTAVQEITSVDNVVHETLRLYPPGSETDRYCTKSTVVNGLTIPKGVSIAIPIGLIHRNPLYWKDPEKFDPDRFSPEEKTKRPQICFMPFGFGPRICIGMRLAMLETKVALIQVLRKYTFVRVPETEVPPKLGVGIFMRPREGIVLKVESRQ